MTDQDPLKEIQENFQKSVKDSADKVARIGFQNKAAMFADRYATLNMHYEFRTEVEKLLNEAYQEGIKRGAA